MSTVSTTSDAPRTKAAVDTESLMRIRNLELRAKVVVEGFMSGIHRSPYHGFSVEFSEYREYSPGDDVRYLDWRLAARIDRYYIKRFEEETNLRCHFVVDMSRSMGFSSLSYDKAEYARTTAATLAYFLTSQRDGVGVLTFDETIGEYLPARYRPGHLRRLMMCLERSLAGTATDIARPLEEIASRVTKRGLLVLISDLMAPIDTLHTHLGYLRSRGHEVIVLRVLDPAELDFGFTEPSMFFDMESGRNIYVDPSSERENYLRRFAEHRAGLQESCDAQGIDLLELRTDTPLDVVLFDFLNTRARRSGQAGQRHSRRHGASSHGAPSGDSA